MPFLILRPSLSQNTHLFLMAQFSAPSAFLVSCCDRAGSGEGSCPPDDDVEGVGRARPYQLYLDSTRLGRLDPTQVAFG